MFVDGLQEVAAVIEMHMDARIVVGAIGMIPPADPLDHRIDLDRVDTMRAPRQRPADVVARSGADDQHLAERLAAGITIEEMRQGVGGKRRITRLHLLMADQVDVDLSLGGTIVDAVVRRPHLLRSLAASPRGLHREDQHERRSQHEHQAAAAVLGDEEPGETCHHDRKPERGRQLEERTRREQDDAGEAAEDVDGVGLEPVRNARQATPKLLSRPHHRQRDHEEEVAAERLDRNHEARKIAGLILDAEEHHLGRGLVADVDHPRVGQAQPLNAVRAGERDDQDERRPQQQVALAVRGEAADGDPENRCEQDGVGEKSQEQDVRWEPANAGKLEKEREQANQE